MINLKTRILLLGLSILFSEGLTAQCKIDRHNTTLSDAWVSCDRKQSPNPTRGFSHWVLYEFDDFKAITSLKAWNLNHPEHLDNGSREIIIDYSVDGQSWTELSTIELEKAPGRSDYEGSDPIDIPEVSARYILMTMISNHGGSCVGLSEVRFGVLDQTTSSDDLFKNLAIRTFPNPFSERITVSLVDVSAGIYRYDLIAANGQTITRSSPFEVSGDYQFDIKGTGLSTGIYLLKVYSQEAVGVREISVVHPK